MVDASAGVRESPVSRQQRSGMSGNANLRAVVLEGDAAHEAYAGLCEVAVHAPPQSPLWIESWAANRTPQLVALLTNAGEPAMALALEIGEAGPFRIARFVGGSHANGNFPATAHETLAAPDGRALEIMAEAIRHARPDIDMLLLERQLPCLDGVANPLAALPHNASPNVALAASLEGGFDTLLSRVNGKRKRKKYRSQLRKFEEAGGFRRFRASNAAEVERVLAAFFEMRAQRFSAQGIADVFAGEATRDAFLRLYTGALAQEPAPFYLEALEVGGKIRAVTGSSRFGKRIVCDFCAFSDDELTAASPGEFLFFENIREACEDGIAIYDFSVGEERYKRAWCDIETVQFDICVPLTLKGRLLAQAQGALTLAKRVVKNNTTLFAIARKLRRARRTTAPDETE